ncbi:Acyl transferase/acyl hydrolase/lysophospholipase [Trinorchestia longiramus]|nr:Acyl transferase/acyl hydrolase/lysophospholipase [Trinorchestia longiramus]
MAVSLFGQTCASAFRRQSLCLHIPKLRPESLHQCGMFNAASAKTIITNASSSLLKLPSCSSIRVIVGRGSPVDVCAAAAAGASKHLHTSEALLADKVNITFKTEKESVTLSGAVGDSLLDIVNNNSYEIDGFGACDGTVACSTCHCVLDQATFNLLNKGVTEEEQDLLDMASGRQETHGLSLAGCGFLAPYVLGAVTCLRETDYWMPVTPTASPVAMIDTSSLDCDAKKGISRRPASENGLTTQRNCANNFISCDIQTTSETSTTKNASQEALRQHVKNEQSKYQLSECSPSISSTRIRAVETHCFSKIGSERQYALQSCNPEHELRPAGGVGMGGNPTMVAGASAGALLGVALLAGSPSLDDLWHTFMSAARDSAHFTFGPFSRKFVMESYIREAMEALPADVHKRLSGKFFVSVTDVKSMKNLLVSEWDTREDLIECLLCSCYIPMFSGGSVPLFRGRPCIDGGFTNNQPKPFKSSLCISPFAGRAHICPKQTTSRSMYIHVANADLLLSRENFVRFYRAVVPHNTRDLYQLYWQGFKDAEQFLLSQRDSLP